MNKIRSLFYITLGLATILGKVHAFEEEKSETVRINISVSEAYPNSTYTLDIPKSSRIDTVLTHFQQRYNVQSLGNFYLIYNFCILDPNFTFDFYNVKDNESIYVMESMTNTLPTNIQIQYNATNIKTYPLCGNIANRIALYVYVEADSLSGCLRDHSYAWWFVINISSMDSSLLDNIPNHDLLSYILQDNNPNSANFRQKTEDVINENMSVEAIQKSGAPFFYYFYNGMPFNANDPLKNIQTHNDEKILCVMSFTKLSDDRIGFFANESYKFLDLKIEQIRQIGKELCNAEYRGFMNTYKKDLTLSRLRDSTRNRFKRFEDRIDLITGGCLPRRRLLGKKVPGSETIIPERPKHPSNTPLPKFWKDINEE